MASPDDSMAVCQIAVGAYLVERAAGHPEEIQWVVAAEWDEADLARQGFAHCLDIAWSGVCSPSVDVLAILAVRTTGAVLRRYAVAVHGMDDKANAPLALQGHVQSYIDLS